MVALVSSTVFPPEEPVYGEVRSRFDHEARLRQTIETVRSLQRVGISEIYVADNSGRAWQQAAATELEPARVFVFDQFPFHNKGISEAYLLLRVLSEIPKDQAIMKISGRYKLVDSPPELGDADFAVKFSKDNRSVSTRAYLVRNRCLFEQLVKATLQEIFCYGSRIVGPRSLIRVLRNTFSPLDNSYCYYDPSIGLELAVANVLRRAQWRVRRLPVLGIQGEIATVAESVSE